MYINIRELVVKYSLIFIVIFSIIFMGSTYILTEIDYYIEFGLIHFSILLVLTFLVFFSFLFFKLLKFNISLLKLMQLQAQVDDIRREIEKRRNFNDEFAEKLNENNNKKK